MSQAKLINCPFYSDGFPILDDCILRKQYFRTIEDALKSNDVLFLEGRSDSGKTVLLGQYGKSDNNTITVFFNQFSSLDFTADYFLRNVSNQICHLLNENPDDVDDDTIGSVEFYQRKVQDLCRKKKRSREQVVIIIDGLESCIENRKSLVQELFSIMPLKKIPFKIVLSGKKESFQKLIPELKKAQSRVIDLSPFSEYEIIHYLGLKDEEYVDELYEITSGLPGRLVNIKRKIDAGTPLEEIVDYKNYKEFIEEDCVTIDEKNENLMMILSILALDDKPHSIDSISKLTELLNPEIQNLISPIDIVTSIDSKIQFISNAHRSYFTDSLRANREMVDDLLIRYYADQQNSESIGELPILYSRKERWDDVITVINKDSMKKILESTGSLKTVNDYISYGITASQKRDSFSDLWRFSFQGSIVNELDNYLFWESEIEARSSIRDYDGAINLANSAILKIDKLSLLTLVAKLQRELDSNVDSELENLIRELYSEVDLSSAGEKIYEIVSNLIYALPNLAIELIEGGEGENDSDDNINDWVLSKLSTGAIESAIKSSEDNHVEQRLDALQKIGGAESKKLNRALRFLVGKYDSKKVISEVQKLQDPNERLKLIRLWLTNYKGEGEVYEVIKYGLQQLVEVGSTIPDIKDLGELTSHVPTIEDLDKRKSLYSSFRKIEGDFKTTVFVKNRFRYQLHMFHVKFSIDKNGALKQLDTFFSDIGNLPDEIIKLEVYSELYSTLCKIEDKAVRNHINLVYKNIITLFEEVYVKTSYHEEISKSIIEILGKDNVNLCLKIIGKVNTKGQRLRLYVELLEAYLNNPIAIIRWDLLEKILNQLSNKRYKQNAIETIVERFSEEKELDDSIILKLMPYFNMVDDFLGSMNKSYITLYILKVLDKNDIWREKLEKRFLSKLHFNWSNIEADWSKIDFGFKICSELPECYAEFKGKLFNECIEIKKESWLDSRKVAYVYNNCVKLVIHSFYGLAASGKDDKNDLAILKKLINRIPSAAFRLDLWCECAYGMLDLGRNDLFNGIMDKFITTELETLKSGENASLINGVHEVYTLLFIYNSALKDYYEECFSEEVVEIAIMRCCEYLLSGEAPYKPYDGSRSNYSHDFGNIISAQKQMALISNDSNFYYCVKLLCEALSKTDKREISDIQLTTILNELTETVELKLPDQENVKHEGYLILSEVQILSARRRGGDKDDWVQLIERSKLIPNRSDKILVMSELLRLSPPSKFGLKEEQELLASEIYSSLDVLKESKINYEFIHRTLDVTEVMYKHNQRDWKERVNEAFSFSKELKSGADVYSMRTDMIDTMYKLNPDFAKQLVEQNMEQESGRKVLKKRIEDHYKSLEMSKKIRENQTIEKVESKNRDIFVKGVYSALKSLNSNLITPKKINELMEYLPHGNKAPLHEVFPIFSYYLTNCQKVYTGKSLTGRVQNIHRDNFTQAVEATELTEILLHNKKLKTGDLSAVTKGDFTNKIFHPGDRREALDFIREWLHDHLKGGTLIISDPFFKKNDLDLLKLVLEINKNVKVSILASEGAGDPNLEDDLMERWREISQQDPPITDMTYCWIPSDGGISPFHDRHILTEDGGLRVGTSVNSVGGKKESEISVMSYSDAENVRQEILNEYLTRSKRIIDGHKVKYNSFNLW